MSKLLSIHHSIIYLIVVDNKIGNLTKNTRSSFSSMKNQKSKARVFNETKAKDMQFNDSQAKITACFDEQDKKNTQIKKGCELFQSFIFSSEIIDNKSSLTYTKLQVSKGYQSLNQKLIALQKKNQRLILKLDQFQQQNKLLRSHIQKILQENQQWSQMYENLLYLYRPNKLIPKPKSAITLPLQNVELKKEQNINKIIDAKTNILTNNKEISQLSFNHTKRMIENLQQIVSQGQLSDRTNRSQVIQNLKKDFIVQKFQFMKKQQVVNDPDTAVQARQPKRHLCKIDILKNNNFQYNPCNEKLKYFKSSKKSQKQKQQSNEFVN